MSGMLSRLQVLNLQETNIRDEGGEALASVLQTGACPQLRALYLDRCFSRGGLRALARALRAGACAALQELVLNDNKADPDEVRVIV
jgi:Ran GTPase-activating protein (RanGAP) involved in mRNA processing and transport